ncbi:hypothetical protein [uncultured Ruminococcus sp.]|nr:hypothetical protein [uncultured Ruminococcus sp.]
MNEEYVNETFNNDSERLSQELERDARRYNKAFTEEEEVRLI